MRLVVVGTGYVGLVTGACLADIGHDVLCVDNDPGKIAALKQGTIPIYEPGLEDLVALNADAGRLHFATDLRRAVSGADVVFIAVGTPLRLCDGHADRSAVFAVARDMAKALPSSAVVVVKSTVPVGTGHELELLIADMRGGRAVPVVSNPEFLRAGSAVKDFMEPDRIVVGTESEWARGVMERLYAPLGVSTPLVFTARRSSELIKYGANALLATKVAFINEMADLCERAGADVKEVSHGIGLDRRIGSRFLEAGPGFGGSCFRKDATALVKMGEDHDVAMRIAEAVVASNETRKRMLVRKVAAAAGGSLRNKAVAVWGLTFKANTDDVRDAPAIPLVTALLDAGAQVRVFDPEGIEAVRSLWPGRVTFASSAATAAKGAEILVVMTEWDIFLRADMAATCRQMAKPVLVDMRNLYTADRMHKLGFEYHRIGKAPADPAGDPARPLNGHMQERPARDDPSRGAAREVATISLS